MFLVRFALTEGYGVVSERIIRDRFFSKMSRKLGIRSVLEVPADGTSGLPGINSTCFAQQGCRVTIANTDEEFLEKSEELWKAMRLQVNPIRPISYERLPFKDCEFDLVWNYCEIEKSRSPQKLLKEMTRVSRNFVLIMIQNSLTYGYFIHRIHHRYFNKPWNHGNPKLMRIEKIIHLAKECDLKILETGLIDAPPFPDTWELMLFPLSTKKDIQMGIKELQQERKIPLSVEVIYLFERYLPWSLKLIFAHHPYVLANKGA